MSEENISLETISSIRMYLNVNNKLKMPTQRYICSIISHGHKKKLTGIDYVFSLTTYTQLLYAGAYISVELFP